MPSCEDHIIDFSKLVVLEAGIWDGTNLSCYGIRRAVAGHCDVSSTFVKPRIAKRMIYRLLKGKKKVLHVDSRVGEE